MKNYVNLVCAVLTAALFLVNMFSCAFNPQEINKQTKPAIEHIKKGIPNAVKISGLKQVSVATAGGRSITSELLEIDKDEIR